MTPPARVEREPAWLGEGEDRCLGWFHSAPEAGAGDVVAVLCGPLGHEYTRAHRTLRHLADRLARAGVPALRFDYHGCGDSAGGDLDPGRLAAWEGSIRAAIGAARHGSGCARVCLVGVRLGASLACRVAEGIEVDSLVLWNPCVQGRAYVRELQAIAAAAEGGACGIDGALESAGFIMSSETLAGVRAIDLLAAHPRAQRALVVARDDLASDEALPRHLAALGIPCDQVRAPGWAGMMAEHQFTVVPDAALATIVDWIKNRGQTTIIAGRTTNFAERKSWSVPGFSEVLCRFGQEEGLFGILSGAGEDKERPVVLMFNAGAVHHVGPNRIYVLIARRLAALGIPCLRFDIEGIGDSVLRGAGRENHPYAASAMADARAAIAHLRERHGYRRFVALGLCSGAHNAFHAGLALADDAIEELVLINPLTFYWVEGMSLETTTRAYDAIAYRKSMRDPRRWMKLLRGDVNFARLFDVALAYPRTAARNAYDAVCETLAPAKGPRLARDLRALLQRRRRLTFLIAEGDPGRDLLMAGARRTTARALKAGALRLEMIPAADHTFSRHAPREDLIARLEATLASGRRPAPDQRMVLRS